MHVWKMLTEKPLVLILLTDKWENCVIYLQVLCFAMMWNPIHSLNLNLLFVKGRSELFLRLEIVKKIIGATILCVTIPFGLVAMCCGQVVSSLIFLFVNTYYTGKLIHVGFVQQIKDLLPTMMYTAIMGLFVWFLSSAMEILLVQLLVGFLMGIPLYILTSKMLKSQEYFFMRDLVKQNVPARLKLLKRWR